MKKLIEKRNALMEEAEQLLAKCETETRALNEEEAARYDELSTEIAALGKTIEARAAMEKISEPPKPAVSEPEEKKETQEEAETRAFAQIIRTSKAETRANFDYGGNGAVIPESIAKTVIRKVTDLCPILAGATVFHSKGTLKIPIYGESTGGGDITVGYSSDFTELTANAGAFSSVDLSGYLAGALTLIGKTLLNSSDLDLVSFVTDEMAKKISIFIEKELLIGTADKCTGAISTTNTISAAAIAADDLIALQARIKQAYQPGACWTMHPDTFTAIRQLKDGNGRYLIQDDVTQEFPYRLLGKPVYVSDNMEKIENGKRPILYGNYSGLAVNIREGISIQVLLEKYATQHAVGIVSWFEMDSKIMDSQRLAVLKISSAG